MQIDSLAKVRHSAFAEAANRLGRNLDNPATASDRDRLRATGLAEDQGKRIVDGAARFRAAFVLQRALQTRYEGEALDPQRVLDRAVGWFQRAHIAADVAKADGDAESEKLALYLGVGQPLPQSIREARVMLETMLSVLAGVNVKRFGETDAFLPDAQALVDLFVKEVDERDDVLVTREVATRRLYELKEDVVTLCNQVLSRIDAIESREGEPEFVGYDLGELRALVATRGMPVEDPAEPEPPATTGL